MEKVILAKPTEMSHPQEKASVLSQAFFCWLLPFFIRGYKKEITEDDLYGPLKAHESNRLGNLLEVAWSCQETKNKSFLMALLTVFHKEFILYALLLLVQEFVVKLSQPLLIARFLKFHEPKQTDMSKEDAYICAALIIFFALVNVLCVHRYYFCVMHLGMKLRVAASSVIYRKALKLNKSAFKETTVGQMVNLLSNDVGRFDLAVQYIHNLWVAPIETAVIIYLLHVYVGPTGLAGVVFLILFTIPQIYMGKKISLYRLNTAKHTDERVRLMSEILTGIQVIKMYAWEKPFYKLIDTLRRKELKHIGATSVMRAIMITCVTCLHRTAIYLCILTYVLTGSTVNATYIYTLASFYGILRQAVTMFVPRAVTQFSETRISLSRIEDFMLREEKVSETGDNIIEKGTHHADNKDSNVICKPIIVPSNAVGIHLENVSVKWNSDLLERSLDKVRLSANSNQLVAITGKVGSGKSTIFYTILKELLPIEGCVDIDGTISYASQEPWLFGGTIVQNIIFGEPFDLETYTIVVKVCALETDFMSFPYGDQTIIGDRGITLSGGQRARINLARAVYRNADIYLLDDPLSAVDTTVGKQIFEECICGYLKNKCVVLITNQIQYLRNVNPIYVIQSGKVVSVGSFTELQEIDQEFSNLLAEHVEKEEEKPKIIQSETKQAENGIEKNLDGNNSVKEVEESISESTKLLHLKHVLNEHINNNINNNEKDIELQEARNTKFPGKAPHVKEQRGVGNISKKVYTIYLLAGGNWLKGVLVLLTFLMAQVFAILTDYFVILWVNLEQRRFQNERNSGSSIKDNEYNRTLYNETHFIEINNTSRANNQYFQHNSWEYILTEDNSLIIYSTLVIFAIALALTRSLSFFRYCLTASNRLHNFMFRNIIRAPLRFFNVNPSGRILNRFSKDIGILDEALPLIIADTLQIAFILLSISVVIGILNPWILLPTTIIVVIFYFLRLVFLATSRDLKRVEAITRSPIYTHLTASVQGLATIRAFGAQRILQEQFDNYQNIHSGAYYLFLAANRTFGFWLDFHCVVYTAFIIISILFIQIEMLAGNVGYALTEAVGLTGMFQWGIRQWSEMENQMTSVERIQEYIDINPESNEITKMPPKFWPEHGNIKFENVSLRYSPEDCYVLYNISIQIKSKEKVGIVGRTGAGKSSLITALFRLTDVDGEILIDNTNIKEIPLTKLRSKISIIPQEPVLFYGKLRKNLDPFDEFNDHVLWNALENVELKNVIKSLPSGLDETISEGGCNFSVGQRQLICLARAIIRNNIILVLDEATANVDPHTEGLIQTTIRKKFAHCTVLTIAHRLHSIMDFDRVLVMDGGAVAEFDNPHTLLQNSNGIFYRLVNDAVLWPQPKI